MYKRNATKLIIGSFAIVSALTGIIIRSFSNRSVIETKDHATKEGKNMIPDLIFKYRALSSREDIDRFYDIIKNNRLYLPTIPQVNDPFEGKVNASFGICGEFIREAMDIDISAVSERKAKTRLLSLSEDCFSPQLWAYYCNNYHGACLCYKTDKSFSKIKPVEYSDVIGNKKKASSPSLAKIYDLIKESMLIKQKGWKYEKEWRIIFQPILNGDYDSNEKDVDSFMSYDHKELVGIIIGERLEDNMKEIIAKLAPDNVKLFETHTGARTGKVKIQEYGYQYDGSGAPADYISTVRELFDRINR